LFSIICDHCCGYPLAGAAPVRAKPDGRLRIEGARYKLFTSLPTYFSIFIAYYSWSVAVHTTLCHFFSRLPFARWYGCRSSSDGRCPRPLVAMSSLASLEVASRTMVASVLQPIQHDDELLTYFLLILPPPDTSHIH